LYVNISVRKILYKKEHFAQCTARQYATAIAEDNLTPKKTKCKINIAKKKKPPEGAPLKIRTFHPACADWGKIYSFCLCILAK
jgi:hypothetical protein